MSVCSGAEGNKNSSIGRMIRDVCVIEPWPLDRKNITPIHKTTGA
jgi:hypothetical protein